MAIIGNPEPPKFNTDDYPVSIANHSYESIPSDENMRILAQAIKNSMDRFADSLSLSINQAHGS